MSNSNQREVIDQEIMNKVEEDKAIKLSEHEIMQMYKNNLPHYMNEKLQALSEKIYEIQKDSRSEFSKAKKLSLYEINEILHGKKYFCGTPTYTAEEMDVIFEYYRKFIITVNKIKKYPPSKENFCAFAGISTGTYNQYMLNGVDEEKAEVMMKIDDYIRDSIITSAQVGDLREVTTIFRGKASHGMVEASAPVVIRHDNSVDIEKVNQLIKRLEKNNK